MRRGKEPFTKAVKKATEKKLGHIFPKADIKLSRKAPGLFPLTDVFKASLISLTVKSLAKFSFCSEDNLGVSIVFKKSRHSLKFNVYLRSKSVA